MRALIISILLLLPFVFNNAQAQGAPDEAALNRLSLAPSNNIQLRPGQSYQFGLSVIECCYFPKPVKARVAWSVQPHAGARIDPRSGLLSVDGSTPSGSVFTVNADVENGRRNLSIKVYVYTPEANPLVGVWGERSQIKCGGGRPITPETPVGELEFRADGTFSVTWIPFEVYRDYVGSYTFDLKTGRIKFVVTGGNYVPPHIDGEGNFSIDRAGDLILKNVWLGSKNGEPGAGICGLVFRRL